MTDAELDELERLELEATDPPWRQDGDGPYKIHHGSACDRIVTCHSNVDRTRATGSQNATLIAALRNAAPELIRLARERNVLVKERDYMRIAIDGCDETSNDLREQCRKAELERNRYRDALEKMLHGVPGWVEHIAKRALEG